MREANDREPHDGGNEEALAAAGDAARRDTAVGSKERCVAFQPAVPSATWRDSAKIAIEAAEARAARAPAVATLGATMGDGAESVETVAAPPTLGSPAVDAPVGKGPATSKATRASAVPGAASAASAAARSSAAAVAAVERPVEVWVTVALRVHLEHRLTALPRWHAIAFAASGPALERKRAALELELAFQAEMRLREEARRAAELAALNAPRLARMAAHLGR